MRASQSPALPKEREERVNKEKAEEEVAVVVVVAAVATDAQEKKVVRDAPELRVVRDAPDLRVERDAQDLREEIDIPEQKVVRDIPEPKVVIDIPEPKVAREDSEVPEEALEVAHVHLETALNLFLPVKAELMSELAVEREAVSEVAAVAPDLPTEKEKRVTLDLPVKIDPSRAKTVVVTEEEDLEHLAVVPDPLPEVVLLPSEHY